MTPAQKKIAKKLLHLASSEFSNHGCNNFRLMENGGLTWEEAEEVEKQINLYAEEEDICRNKLTYDWLLMLWVAKLLDD